MVDVDLGNPWVLGALLIAIFIAASVGIELRLLDGNVREALMRGLFGGGGFAVVYVFLRSRYGEGES